MNAVVNDGNTIVPLKLASLTYWSTVAVKLKIMAILIILMVLIHTGNQFIFLPTKKIIPLLSVNTTLDYFLIF